MIFNYIDENRLKNVADGTKYINVAYNFVSVHSDICNYSFLDLVPLMVGVCHHRCCEDPFKPQERQKATKEVTKSCEKSR
jgi:hypothetical protein